MRPLEPSWPVVVFDLNINAFGQAVRSST